MIYEGMTVTSVNDEKEGSTAHSSEFKIITPGEFCKRSIETQIMEINEAMTKALSAGNTEFLTRMPIIDCLSNELQDAGWIVENKIYTANVLLDKNKFELYDANMFIENVLKSSESKEEGSIFLTAEEYYRKVRRQQIIRINELIEKEISKGTICSINCKDILPSVIKMFEKEGWAYNKQDGKIFVTTMQQCWYTKDFYEQKDKIKSENPTSVI